MTGLELAKMFHEVYESLAPNFGYETREDTREFDSESKNGRLMVATCEEILERTETRALYTLAEILCVSRITAGTCSF